MSDGDTAQRRGFLSRVSGAAMALGLALGYGSFAARAARFLYPSKKPQDQARWLFVADLSGLSAGDSIEFEAPSGARAVIARKGEGTSVEDFVALSSVCPHLGCIVHWEAENDRFFCPCHNGTFDATGKGTGGPPGKAGQSLARFPLKIEGGLLFIEMPSRSLAKHASSTRVRRAGHEACLGAQPPIKLRPAPSRKS